MLIGVRGHDLLAERTSIEELAKKAQEEGFQSVQLVPYKSLCGVSEQYGQMTPAFAFKIMQAFRKQDLHLAMLGSYFNLLEKDFTQLVNAKKRFKEYLRFAKECGCYLVGTETGSYQPDWSYHPDNHSESSFAAVTEIFRELAVAAGNHGVCLGIEGAWHHVIYSPQKMQELLQRLDSDNVLVVFDAVNLFNPNVGGNATTAMRKLIEESFALFGDRIAVIHAKDFVLESGERRQVPLGEGIIDYEHFLGVVKNHKPTIDIVIEGLSGEELRAGKRFLEMAWRRV